MAFDARVCVDAEDPVSYRAAYASTMVVQPNVRYLPFNYVQADSCHFYVASNLLVFSLGVARRFCPWLQLMVKSTTALGNSDSVAQALLRVA
jgi:hypothetical protein